MIRKYSFILAILTYVLSSCTKEDAFDSGLVGNDIVQISAQIETKDPSSRATIGIDGHGVFENYDSFTLFYDSNQQDLTLQSGTWTPGVYWGESDQMSFSGFYPALPYTVYSDFTHTVATDQRSAEAFESSDLLYAPNVYASRGEIVNLEFKHLMSCITVVLSGLTEEEISQAQLIVKAYNKIEIEKDGSLGKLYDYNVVTNVPEITMRYQGNNTFQAIVCPQKFDLDYGMGWLKIHINGKDYYIKDSPINHLRGGDNFTITYRLNKQDIDPDTGTDSESNSNEVVSTQWVYGVTPLPSSNESPWSDIPGSKQKSISYGVGGGWYDCDKVYADDDNLCWAASTSNLIHWWLDCNSDLVSDFCRENNIPTSYGSNTSSEVFQVFKDAFTNAGGYPNQGLNWYFLGKYYNDGSSASLTEGARGKGGYFKDVLSTVSNMAQNHGIYNVDQFSSILKGAFNNRQGISFIITMGGFGGGRHAMTIWGAGFDKNGKIVEIYFCDNNDGPYSCMYSTKVKMVDGILRMQGSDKTGGFTIYIDTVTLLDLKRSELKRYFKK